MKEVFLQKRERLVLEINQMTSERKDLLKRLSKLNVLISSKEKELETLKPKELSVSKHAIQRFKERVVAFSETKIRKILSDPELLEAYERNGSGEFLFKKLPNFVIVIRDYNVLTIYNKFDPKEELRVLSLYMEQYIEDLAKQALDPSHQIMKKSTFRKQLYKR